MTGTDVRLSTDGHHGRRVPVIDHEGNGRLHDGVAAALPIIEVPIGGAHPPPIARSAPALHAKRTVRGRHARDTTRVVGYVRVSTEEQSASGAGLAAQRDAITDEAARRGWDLLDVVEDAGHSGRDLRRPGIAAVLELLRSGDADALVVAKLDRLSRSLLDFAALTARSAKEGWALIALDVAVDTSTPAGEAMASVMVTFAQLERRLIALRTKEALAVKRSQGVRLGRPPEVPDAVVARIEAERLAGRTLQAIADGLQADGIPTAHRGHRWRSSTVHGVLRSAARRAPAPMADRDG